MIAVDVIINNRRVMVFFSNTLMLFALYYIVFNAIRKNINL